MQEKVWEKIHPEYLINSEKFSGSKAAFETVVGAIEAIWKQKQDSLQGFSKYLQNKYVKVFIEASKQFKFNFHTKAKLKLKNRRRTLSRESREKKTKCG